MALATDAAAARARGPGEAAPGDTPGDGAGGPQAPEELIESQLRGILETTQTSAGAVCFFDQHQELLRLAVEVGLSDEGCRRLRTVRRGAATTWDMPLHSLLNRRVYLIESAAKNRYVPPLVDDVATVRAVACVPLLDGSTPVGSLILVALAPRTFGERQIRLLEEPVRALVTSIIGMRKRVALAAPVRSTRPSLASAAAQQAATVKVAGPITPGPKIAPGDVGASSIQAAVERARAELERLRARLAEAEASAASERKRADALEQQRQELDTELQRARAAEAALRADLASANERQAADSATERAAEAEGLAARVAELEATNARLRARTDELDAAAEALRARAAELEATGREALAAAEARLAQTASEADGRVAAAAAESEARLASVITECEALRDRIADLESNGQPVHAESDEHLTSAVAAAQAAAAEARAEAAEWQRRCETAEADLATTHAAAGSHDGLLAAIAREREAWEAERVAWEAERSANRAREDALRQRAEELERRVAEVEGQLTAAQAEDVKLRDGFAHLELLIQTGAEGGNAPSAPGAEAFGSTSFEVVELDGSTPFGDDAGLAGLEVATLDVEEIGEPATAPAAASVAPSAPPASGLAVLDVDGFWSGIKLDAGPVHTVPPGEDVAADVAEKNPERLLVNLAVPQALDALATLRQSGVRIPSCACILLPGQQRGVFIGRFDVTSRPIDPDALLALLDGAFKKGTRVVTAGADVDGLISVRQALARLGLSVSMAWDGKQANDLLAMVNPEVAVIDLELPPKDGCSVVARIALTQPGPLTVVIPKPADSAAAFAAAAALPEIARTMFPAKEIVSKAFTIAIKGRR